MAVSAEVMEAFLKSLSDWQLEVVTLLCEEAATTRGETEYDRGYGDGFNDGRSLESANQDALRDF